MGIVDKLNNAVSKAAWRVFATLPALVRSRDLSLGGGSSWRVPECGKSVSGHGLR